MRRFIVGILFALVIGALVACGGNDEGNDGLNDDDFVILEVDFTVPETAEVGEPVELHAFVTYGDEDVTDAKVVFEIWEEEDEEMEDSVKFDAENHGDGSYTIEHVFEEPGTYEMYAHTDAHNMHTMPLKSIVIE